MNHLELLIYRSRHQELAVRNQTFSCMQGVSCTHKIKWSGKNTPTFSASSSLPDGYTLSTAGILAYDGTACTPDTYAVTVTATDGETTVTATMTIIVAQAVINFSAQNFKFKIGTAKTVQLVATSDTTPITFAVSSGTLPTGVSLASDGTLTYDGTAISEMTETVQVTASAPFSQSVTASIGLTMAVIIVPDDYVFYAPLTDNLADESTVGRTCTPSRNEYGNEVSLINTTTYMGMACTYIPRGAKLIYSPNGGISLGNTAKSESLWINCAFNVGGWNVGLSVGQNSSYKLFALGWNDARVAFGGYTNDIYSDVLIPANEWHHIAVTYDTTAIRLYLDGELVKTNSQSNRVNTADSDICVGGRPTSSDDGCDSAYFHSARIYNRCLTDAEVLQLAREFDESSSN